MLKKIATLLGGRNGGLIVCAVEVVVGILLLIDPVAFTNGIIIAAGVALTALGVWRCVGYFRGQVTLAGSDLSLMKGILLAVLGLFCIFNSQWFLVAFPVLSVLYGVLMLVTGVTKLQWMADLLRLRHPRWYLPGVSALLYLLIAIVVLVNPFGAAVAAWMFVGVSMIVSAIVDGVSLLMAR